MTLKIVSWNIFFKDFDYKWRINNICKEIISYNPDVICLQEVIPEFWDIIQTHFGKEYENAYKHPFINNTSDRTYGEVILSKIPIIKRGFFKLSSCQGRVNTWIDIKSKQEYIRINTAHLESFQEDKYKQLRQNQIAHIEKENSGKWIWIGDSNMRDDELNTMYKPICDNKATYHHNRFLNYDGTSHLEYDKVWVNDINVINWTKIGTKQIDNKWLSDHDGIMVEIMC